MRLSRQDLNLFIVFDAIYTARNLTRAAEVLCITQPAVSNSLTRLRSMFDDPLFVRTPGAMVPTPVADNVIDRVREALQLLQSSIQEGELFEPSSANKTFRISMSDLPEALTLPSLQESLGREAPDIRIESYYTLRQNTANELATGTLDLAIEAPLLNDPNLIHQPLINERYVCMLRKGHKAATSNFTLDDYLNLGHIHISSRKQGMGHVELALNSLGLERRIQLRAQHYMVAPLITMRTDLALTLPLSLALMHDVEILELPFSIPKLEWHLYWHKSTDQDPANKWMRTQLIKCCTPSV